MLITALSLIQLSSALTPSAATCQTYQSVLTVCQKVSLGAVSTLTISYTGSLTPSSNLSAYVKLNGRDGVFGLTYSNNMWSAVLTDGVVCDSETGTRCQQPPAQMKSLFRNAYDRSRTPPWNVEVAIVNSQGVWDSNSGYNYTFSFLP